MQGKIEERKTEDKNGVPYTIKTGRNAGQQYVRYKINNVWGSDFANTQFPVDAEVKYDYEEKENKNNPAEPFVNFKNISGTNLEPVPASELMPSSAVPAEAPPKEAVDLTKLHMKAIESAYTAVEGAKVSKKYKEALLQDTSFVRMVNTNFIQRARMAVY